MSTNANVVPIKQPYKRLYPHWIHGYLHHQRQAESPIRFHFWTAVFTVAAALQRKVWIDELKFQWTPNMYIILVGPPGVAAKSTTMRQGLSMLEHVPDIRFGPQSMTWQALLESFAQAQTSLPIDGEDRPMACISVGIGELGTFFDPQNKELTDQLTALWDGQLERLGRRTRKDGEVVVINPWLNLIACTTPAWLQERFPKVAIGGGLTSRIVFVYGDRPRRLIAYPSQEAESETYKAEQKALIYDLKHIATLQGQYRLTPEAISYGTKWYADLKTGKLPDHLRSGRFDGYVSRKQSHVHKLAIVLAASKRDDLIITLEDLKEAEKHVAEIEPDMAKVFDSIGAHESAQTVSEIEAYIERAGQVTSTELWKSFYTTMDHYAFRNAVDAAAAAGIISIMPIPGEAKMKMLTWIGKRKGKKDGPAEGIKAPD